jgi:hypothetical protein
MPTIGGHSNLKQLGQFFCLVTVKIGLDFPSHWVDWNTIGGFIFQVASRSVMEGHQ